MRWFRHIYNNCWKLGIGMLLTIGGVVLGSSTAASQTSNMAVNDWRWTIDGSKFALARGHGDLVYLDEADPIQVATGSGNTPATATVTSVPTKNDDSSDASTRVYPSQSASAVDWGDNSKIAVGTTTGDLIVLDEAQHELLRTTLPDGVLGDMITSVKWSPQHGNLIAVNKGAVVFIVNAATLQVIRQLDSDLLPLDLAWSHDGSRLAATTTSGGGSYDPDGFIVWDADSGQLVFEQTDSMVDTWYNSIAWKPTSSEIVAAGRSDGRVFIWNIASKTQVSDYTNTLVHQPEHWDTPVDPPIGPVQVAWNPNGHELAVGYNKNIQIWDSSSGQLLRNFESIETPIRVSWNVAGNSILVASSTELSVLKAIRGQIEYAFSAPANGAIRDVVWSPDGSQLAYVGYQVVPSNQLIHIVDIPTATTSTHTNSPRWTPTYTQLSSFNLSWQLVEAFMLLHYSSISPRCTAIRTASVRLPAPSLPMIALA